MNKPRYNNELLLYLFKHGINMSRFLKPDKKAYLYDLPSNLLPSDMKLLLKKRLKLIVVELNRLIKLIEDYITNMGL